MANKIRNVAASITFVLAGYLGLGTPGMNNLSFADEVEVSQHAQMEFSQENQEIFYKAAEDYLYDYFAGEKKGRKDGWVDFMSGSSKVIKKRIKSRGIQNVVEDYVQFQRLCLDLAVSRLHQGMTQEDIDRLGDYAISIEKTRAEEFGETLIDYDYPSIKEGYNSFARARTEFFQEILEANIDNPVYDFKEMIRRAFPTKKDFEIELGRQIEAKQELYAGLTESLKYNPNQLVRKFGPGVIGKIRKRDVKYNPKEAKRVYDVKRKKDKRKT